MHLEVGQVVELREDDDLNNLIEYDENNPACNPPLRYNMAARLPRTFQAIRFEGRALT